MKKERVCFLLVVILLSCFGGAIVKLNFDKAFYAPGSKMRFAKIWIPY